MFKPWDYLCKAKMTRKCNFINMQNASVWQNDRILWANVAILCPVRCCIALNFLGIYIRDWKHHVYPSGWIGTIKFFCEGLSFIYRTVILKVLIPVSLLLLQSGKSLYQSQYQDWNLESLDTSLNIKTAIQKSWYQSRYQD